MADWKTIRELWEENGKKPIDVLDSYGQRHHVAALTPTTNRAVGWDWMTDSVSSWFTEDRCWQLYKPEAKPSKYTPLPVLKNDNGIRPAGKPDECFYCNKKVGDFHDRECVTIAKEVKLHATVAYITGVPYHWDKEQIEKYHFNSFKERNAHELIRMECVEIVHEGPLRSNY